MKKLIVQNLLLGKIPLEKFATMNNIFVFWKQKVFLEKIWLIKRGIKWSQLKKGPLGTINTQLLHLNWFTDFFIFFIFLKWNKCCELEKTGLPHEIYHLHKVITPISPFYIKCNVYNREELENNFVTALYTPLSLSLVLMTHTTVMVGLIPNSFTSI